MHSGVGTPGSGTRAPRRHSKLTRGKIFLRDGRKPTCEFIDKKPPTQVGDALLLAPFKDLGDIKLASGIGSHTAAAMRVIDYVRGGGKILETEVTKEAGLTSDGYLKFEKIAARCKGIAAALDNGMPQVYVVRKEIADLVPDVMRILSEGDNAKHDSFQKESFVQTMHNIHRRIQNLRPSTDLHFSRIAMQVSRARSGSHHVEAALAYTEFVRHYAGQRKGLLCEIENYIRTLVVSREVPFELFRDLARLQLVDQPLYVVALVKATMNCHKSFTKTGVARVFMPPDLSSITGSNAARVRQATKIQIEARRIVSTLGVMDCSAAVRAIGDLDCRLVWLVHEKKTDKKFTSMAAIGVQFYEDLTAAFGEARVCSVECPWHCVRIAAPACYWGDAGTMGTAALLPVNEYGTVTTEMAKSSGYTVGAHLRCKEDNKIVEVIAFTEDKITLKGSNFDKAITLSEVMANWEPVQREKQVRNPSPHTSHVNILQECLLYATSAPVPTIRKNNRNLRKTFSPTPPQ